MFNPVTNIFFDFCFKYSSIPEIIVVDNNKKIADENTKLLSNSLNFFSLYVIGL